MCITIQGAILLIICITSPDRKLYHKEGPPDEPDCYKLSSNMRKFDIFRAWSGWLRFNMSNGMTSESMIIHDNYKNEH